MKNFENYIGFMIGAIVLGCVFQIAAITFGLITLNYDIYLVLEGTGGSIIYGIYILVDLKMISDNIAIDDYILGAVMLYTDLVMLFLKILQAIGSRKWETLPILLLKNKY